MVKFFTEMRRRNVFRVAATYVVGAWFLVQTAFTLESVMNLPDWFDALFMALMILGFPVAVILAWAFELTPDGFKRTEVVDDEKSIAAETGRKLEYAIIIGLVLVGGIMLANRYLPNENIKIASLAENQAVAVLPFTNRSAEENDAFFADGMHDELLTRLSKISGLEVISRTSVMSYRETEKRIPVIAEELGVAVILEGAVQRAGDRVRITVQLIDGKTDTHLWAEDYNRALTTENIFDIQAEITQAIAAALKTIISGEDQIQLDSEPTQNLAAYEHFLQGKLLSRPNGTNAEALKESLKALDTAVELDPDYAQAHAVKAYVQMALYWFDGRETIYRDAALANLDKAKTLAPNNSETLLAEAFYQYWGYNDFRNANATFDRALKLAPNNVDALAGKAFIARRLGQFSEAETLLTKAARLDPQSFYLFPELALTRSLTGDFEGADAAIAKAKRMRPGSITVAAFAAFVQQFQGDAVGAHREILPAGPYLPQERMNYATATRNPVFITQALEEWPADKRAPEGSPEAYNISKVRALLAMGQDEAAATEIEALRARTATTPPSEDWSSTTTYTPIVIPMLLGDREAVLRIAADYENTAPDDAIAALGQLFDLGEAFARIGEPGRAMDYVDRVRLMTGDYIYQVFKNDPGYDNVREHPRYKALKADYESWAAGRTG